MTDGLTLISLITTPSRETGSTAFSRTWRIPAESTEAFAQAMTERYGQPIHEGLSTVGKLATEARRAVDAGEIMFIDREDTTDG